VFGNLIDDLKAKVDGMLKLAVAGAIAASAAVVAFICFTVALFLWMQQTYGPLEAWLAIGALFAMLAALGAIFLLVLRRRTNKAATVRAQEPSAAARLLQEPAVLLAGLQVLRLVGKRGLIPIILLGAVAGGIMLNHRNGHAGREHVAEAERGAQTDLD
jgi:hypothetical protein